MIVLLIIAIIFIILGIYLICNHDKKEKNKNRKSQKNNMADKSLHEFYNEIIDHYPTYFTNKKTKKP